MAAFRLLDCDFRRGQSRQFTTPKVIKDNRRDAVSWRFVCSNNFEHITALGWYEIRAFGWVSMTGSVEFARYKTSVAAGAKLNSALAFAAKAKVRKVLRPGHPTPILNNNIANGWFGKTFATAEIRQTSIVSFGRTASLRNLWPLVRRAVSVEVGFRCSCANGRFTADGCWSRYAAVSC